MRIIGGKMGGRRISPPANMPHTRPTTDIAKEGLFNILQHRFSIDGIRTLDLFGGTGNISYELASRGAADLTVVEKDPKMYAFIQKMAESLGLHQLKILRSDVFRYLSVPGSSFDFIFAGPPYALTTIDELPKKIVEGRWLSANGWFVLEHTARNSYEGYPLFSEVRHYGGTVFSIFINC